MNKAYNFNLPDASGTMHQLSDFLGKKVVVYFYPKDNTPGCTSQSCAYRDSLSDYEKRNTVIIGISKDSQKSHERFMEKHSLSQLLLSDENLDAIKAYDVLKMKKMFGKEYLGVVRTTFVIDEEGNLLKRFDKVSAKNDAQIVLDYLDSL